MTRANRSEGRAAPALCIAVLVSLSGTCLAEDPPPALEYRDQSESKKKLRSALETSDKQNVWDFQFDAMVADALGTKDSFKGTVAFNFNQCFGGGMIDELVARGWKTAAYTSAAPFDKCSLARCEDQLTGIDPNNPNIRRTESTYSFRFITKAASGGPMPFKQAATKARAEDICGPFSPNKTWKGAVSAQYTSSGAAGDAIQLHRGPNGTNPPGSKYKAILWGGSTRIDRGTVEKADLSGYMNGHQDLAANWNSLERAHAQLLKAGYTEDDIYVCYTGGEARNAQGNPTGKIFNGGPVLPNWVDSGTRYTDMRDAWSTWLKPQVDDKTQVFFWSSFGHGKTMNDANAQYNAKENKAISKGEAFNFEMDSNVAQAIADVHEWYKSESAEDGAYGLPYFEVDTLVNVPLLLVNLNGVNLPLIESLPLDAGGWMYKFAMDDAVVAQLQSLNQTLLIDYDFMGADGGQYDDFASFITMAGPTSGDFANGAGGDRIPAPGSVALLGLAGLLGARRRR